MTEFEREVLGGISELRTHMRTLVGVDGTGGKIKEFDNRLDTLEAESNKGKGRVSWLTHAVTSGVGAGIYAIGAKFFGSHH